MSAGPGDGGHSDAALDRELTVAVAVSTGGWEAQIVSEFDDRSEGVVVVRRCVDLADLLATAGAGIARAVLLSAEFRMLDRDAVARLKSYAVGVVGVVDPADRDQSAARLQGLGVTALVAADAGSAVISQTIRAAVREVGADSPTTFSHPGRLPAPPPQLGMVEAPPPPANGTIVAVWGPTGAPGRSTVALTLADEAARLGVPVLLIDADVYGGVIGPLLGLLDEAPGLAAACRQGATATLDAAGLARLCLSVRPNLRVLTGISRVDRWPEVRPAALEAVLDVARTLVPLIVIDCGFCIEQDEEITFDTAAPRRNGATFVALEAADVAVCVAAADPIGIQRAVRALLDLREVLPEVDPKLLANRLRGSVIGGDAKSQIDAAFERFAGTTVQWFVPDDPRSLDRALAAGRTLAEVAPKSAIRPALRSMAAELTGAELVPQRRRR